MRPARRKTDRRQEDLGRRAIARDSDGHHDRCKDGRRLLTDGPFAETREQLGGYTVIDANDLDEAIAIASGFLSSTSTVSIEVRPIVQFDGLPAAPPRD